MNGSLNEVTAGPDTWHARFFALAASVSSWSKDPERKVGAVVVDGRRRIVSTGYNGFPRGVADTRERLRNVDLKRALTVHAELNAIANAPTSLIGCALYTTRYPCVECAKAIAASGIGLVVAPKPEMIGSWKQSFELATTVLDEAGVTVILLDEHGG